MKEPDFFINKAQTIIDKLQDIDMFELNEIHSQKYFERKMYSIETEIYSSMNSLNVEINEYDLSYTESVNKLKFNIQKLSEIKFDIKLLFNEINDNGLFSERLNNYTNNFASVQLVPSINKSEFDFYIELLNKFIDFLKDYRK